MLDGGSNCDVISRKLAEELKLPMDNVDSTLLLSVEGGNYGPRQFTDFAVSNLEGDVTLPITDALVSDFLTTEEEKPPTNKEIEGVKYLEGVKFDELENKEIGLLISMKHAWTWLSGDSKESTKLNRRAIPVGVESSPSISFKFPLIFKIYLLTANLIVEIQI